MYRIIEAVVPALLAYCGLAAEERLSSLVHDRVAFLPLVMFLIGTSLLHPRLRHMVIITLCYGVAFLALRDSAGSASWRPPFAIDPDLAETLRLTALLLVASLAGVAAITETVQPGTVWARRCYFGAAAMYFTGLGVLCFGSKGSWQAVVLCVTGATALFGCLFADRVVASEAEQEDEPEFSHTDTALQKLRDDEHLRALRDKEWQDPQSTG